MSQLGITSQLIAAPAWRLAESYCVRFHGGMAASAAHLAKVGQKPTPEVNEQRG